MERHEFQIPFTPCRIAILVDMDDDEIDIKVTVLLKYRRNWHLAGGVEIYSLAKKGNAADPIGGCPPR